MYPPDVQEKVDRQEMTAEEAERATIARLDAYMYILWPAREIKLTPAQYDSMRRYVYDRSQARNTPPEVRMDS